MTTNGFVSSEIENKICTIKFYNPKANSLSSGLLMRLLKEFNDISQNDDVNVVVLRSEGEGTFCAGASIDGLLEIDRFEKAKEYFFSFGKLLLSMVRCPKPIIGRIHGKIVGGGVGLAAACDYTVALDTASLRLSELILGIGPFVISPFLIHKIGRASFSYITLDTDWRDAEWGKLFFLYSKVVNSIESLDKEVNSIAERLANFNPIALQKIKNIFWQGSEDWDRIIDERSEISARLILSEISSGRLQKILQKS